MVSLIELQPSRGGGHEVVINYGVIVPDLFEGRSLRAPWWTECHLRGRASNDEDMEIWVPVKGTPDELAQELIGMLDEGVLPVLERYQSEEALLALWRSGVGSGLIRTKQLLFRGILLHRAGLVEELREVCKELADHQENPFDAQALARLQSLL
jgi:hypothetical protein